MKVHSQCSIANLFKVFECSNKKPTLYGEKNRSISFFLLFLSKLLRFTTHDPDLQALVSLSVVYWFSSLLYKIVSLNAMNLRCYRLDSTQSNLNNSQLNIFLLTLTFASELYLDRTFT